MASKAKSALSGCHGQCKRYPDKPPQPVVGTFFEHSWSTTVIWDDPTYRFKDRAILSAHEEYARWPAVPLAESDVVIEARVTAASAYFSTHKTTIYSEYKVAPIQIFKDADSARRGQDIIVLREGGTAKFPSGNTCRVQLPGLGALSTGQTYFLFLKQVPSSQAFKLITAFSAEETVINPVDTSGTGKFETYRNMSIESFVSLLK